MVDSNSDSSSRPSRGASLLKSAALFLAVLLLAPQPDSLPLIAAVQSGMSAFDAGDTARAAEAFASAYARQPWNASLAFQVGQYELASGQYEAALRHLTTTAGLGGWTPELRALAGDAYFGLGDTANALTQWRSAARERPGDVNLNRRLGDAYEATGQFSEAAAAWRQVVEAQPDDANAQFRLGQLLAALDPHAAAAPLERSSALDSALAPQASALVAAIRQGEAQGDEAYLAASVGLVFVQWENWILAEAAFERAIGNNAAYGEAYAYLGLAQDKLGQDGGPALQRAVALAPDSALAHTFLGLHYRRVGQPAQALTELTRASGLDANNPALAAEIARAHEALGEFEIAEEWYHTAARLAPNDPDYALLLAQFYVENSIELRNAGYEAALRALILAPDSAAAHDVLGFDYVLWNDFTSGEKHLRQAIALDPNLASAHYHLAVLLAAQNNVEGAKTEYRRTLELDPQGRYGNLALKALALLESQ